MKKRKLKIWVKDTIFIISIVSVLTVLLSLNSKLEKDFVNNCEELGYSYNYCKVHN